jgi:hypothetical protein
VLTPKILSKLNDSFLTYCCFKLGVSKINWTGMVVQQIHRDVCGQKSGQFTGKERNNSNQRFQQNLKYK